MEHRLSALLQLHLYDRLNTWLQLIGQRQRQHETRIISGLGSGASYITEFTVCEMQIYFHVFWEKNSTHKGLISTSTYSLHSWDVPWGCSYRASPPGHIHAWLHTVCPGCMCSSQRWRHSRSRRVGLLDESAPERLRSFSSKNRQNIQYMIPFRCDSRIGKDSCLRITSTTYTLYFIFFQICYLPTLVSNHK